MKFYQCTYSIVIICFLLFAISCGQNDSNAEPLNNIKNIIVADNGNAGNGSDIEVNFEKQTDNSGVLEYRIMMIKSSIAANFNIDEANGLSSALYSSVLPSNIFPVKGLVLGSDAKDTDGDLITDQESYIAGVLSVSSDSEIASNAYLKSSQAFQLKNNSQLKNHTQSIEYGGGSITRDSKNNLFMATYNVISELGNPDTTRSFPVLKIGPTGNSQEFTSPYTFLGGNYTDDQDGIYQSVLSSGQVLKIDSEGIPTQMTFSGFQLNKADGVFVDKDHNVFVVDPFINTIAKITPDGESIKYAIVPSSPKGITGDNEGNIYVSHNSEEGVISKINVNGEVSQFATIPVQFPENYNAEFIQWLGYLVFHQGDLYVASMSTDRIYKVDENGNVSVFAGSGERGIPRGGVLTANLNRPIGLAFSEDGRTLYVAGSSDTNPVHTQSSRPAAIWKIEIVD